MKKTLSVLAMLVFLSASIANAQKIESDRTEGGVRTIFCEKKNVGGFSDKVKMFVGLTANQKADELQYYLAIQLNTSEVYEVAKGGKCLLKTTAGDVVELVSPAGHSFNPLADMQTVSGFKIMSITALYTITEAQIEQIAGGVSKVRMEVVTERGDELFEKEFKKDKIGSVVKKEKKLIDDALAGKDKKLSLYDDF